MRWLNENAGAVQAIATVVLVVVTSIYVYLTRSLAEATRNEVEATLQEVEATRQEVEVTRGLVEVARDQARATREQAESTARLVETAIQQAEASQTMANETRRARALAYLPVVVPRFAGATGNRLKIKVTNHGAGAALEVKVQWFARSPGIVESSGLIDFAPSLSTTERTEQEVVLSGQEALRVLSQSGGSGFTYNCEYKDVNGGHYRVQVRGNELDILPLNEPARFALDRGPAESSGQDDG
jgi:hypothetical protein